MTTKVLITGANYNNKGAQSMLFIVIDEVKKRIPDCEIYFGCGLGDPKVEQALFKQICFSREGRYIALGGAQAVFNFGVAIVKGCQQFAKGKRANLWNFFDAKKYIQSMDLIIDVSGFALGDKWSKRTNENFLNTIRLAKHYEIPIYIMPQSFGPFRFKPELQFIRDEIRELLPYPNRIFAREQEGYDLLTQEFGLQNVERSCDLVLQNKGIDLKHIFANVPKLDLPELTTRNNVAIIPNQQCLRHGNEAQILDTYKGIVNTLLDAGKEVYVFRHSNEDLSFCKKIQEEFQGNVRVHLLQNNFSCLEYDAFVKEFEFIICSRFHGIVHAYRNYVPVIALGWAVKYQELTRAVGQESYMFDITAEDCDREALLQAIRNMIKNREEERHTIQTNMEKIQQENCFECISEWVKEKDE
jgi:colanic acid/amylovoran biosynthesis protein